MAICERTGTLACGLDRLDALRNEANLLTNKIASLPVGGERGVVRAQLDTLKSEINTLANLGPCKICTRVKSQ